MRTDSYWTRVLQRRVTRRRTVAGLAGLNGSALFLLACGGDEDGPTTTGTGGTTGATSTGTTGSTGVTATGSSGTTGSTGATGTTGATGLVHSPMPTEGKPGGVLRHFAIGDATHFDAVADSSASVVRDSSEPFYPRMLRLKAVEYPEEADGSSEGELAQSWEIAPDKLSITFKIRQGMVWDRRDPTAGRPVDAEDVVFSWQKYVELNPNGAALAYKGGESQAPVESMEAVDAETVRATLHAPNASILAMFSVRDLLYIMPRESDGGFDPRGEVRGHGPYMLEEYVPSSRFTWVKNPDFYIEGRHTRTGLSCRSCRTTRSAWPSSRRATSSRTCSKGLSRT